MLGTVVRPTVGFTDGELVGTVVVSRFGLTVEVASMLGTAVGP